MQVQSKIHKQQLMECIRKTLNTLRWMGLDILGRGVIYINVKKARNRWITPES
jgi:hypothetical protein